MLVATASTTTYAQTHTFTDTNGQSFPAQIIAVKNGAVVIRRSDGKVYSVDVITLSVADRQFLASWKAKTTTPQVTTATTESAIETTLSIGSAKTGDTTQLVARVALANQEECNDFKGLKGTLVLIGQQSGGTSKCQVLAVQKFTCDVPACGKYDFKGPPFNPAGAAPTGSNQPSFPYKGYVFVLQNGTNNIIQFQHSGLFVKDGTEALKLQAGAIFTGPTQNTGRRMRLVTYPDTWRNLPRKNSRPLKAQP